MSRQLQDFIGTSHTMIHTSALCIRPQWAALIWDHKKRLEIRSYSIKIESCVWVPVIESGASLVTGLVQFLGIVENREGCLAPCIVLIVFLPFELLRVDTVLG